MSNRAICFFCLLVAALWLCCGCTEEGNANTSDPSAQTNNVPAALAPESLSGKSYTFTVAANQGFIEPFNSGYTIDFNSETSYTLHPSGQNGQAAPDRQGNYTYDARTGVVNFAETTPESGRTIEAVLTFTSRRQERRISPDATGKLRTWCFISRRRDGWIVLGLETRNQSSAGF